MTTAERLPKIVLTYSGLVVNDELLLDKEWVASALSGKDEDGEPLIRLNVYPSLTGQEAIDAYLSSTLGNPVSTPPALDLLVSLLATNDDLIFRLTERARIRRQISSRRSVQEGKADRLADLLEEAAREIQNLKKRLDNDLDLW